MPFFFFVQGPVSSPASVIELICAMDSGQYTLGMNRRGWRWRYCRRPAGTGPGRSSLRFTETTNLPTRRVSADPLSSFWWPVRLNSSLLSDPLLLLSAIRSPTHSHLVQLQHHRCCGQLLAVTSERWGGGGGTVKHLICSLSLQILNTRKCLRRSALFGTLR